MIVIDASAVVLGLLNEGDARALQRDEALAVPHLVDSEVTHALRRMVLQGDVTEADAERALGTWTRMGVERFAAVGLLDRVWELRANLTAYDATYVALAEALDVALVTADGRLARSPGPRCPVTVVPS